MTTTFGTTIVQFTGRADLLAVMLQAEAIQFPVLTSL